MTRFLAAVAAVVAVGILPGCGGDNPPDTAACKDAMRQQYQAALADPSGPSATQPVECNGLDGATLERLATEVMSEN